LLLKCLVEGRIISSFYNNHHHHQHNHHHHDYCHHHYHYHHYHNHYHYHHYHNHYHHHHYHIIINNIITIIIIIISLLSSLSSLSIKGLSFLVTQKSINSVYIYMYIFIYICIHIYTYIHIYEYRAFLPGDSEIDQLHKIFQVLGTPNNDSWPGVENHPYWRNNYPCWEGRAWDSLVYVFL
jgi:hypothetical protein